MGKKGKAGEHYFRETQDPENFDEEVKSLLTAWRSYLISR